MRESLGLIEPPEHNRAESLELLADGVLSIAAAASFSSLSRAGLYAAMAAGELPYLKRGRRRLIPRRALVSWLADGMQTVGAGGGH